MSNVQLVNRMLSLESTVDADKIRKGRLDSNDWGKLIEGADSIAKSQLIIDDTPGISIAELRSKCRKYKMENNLGLVIIDYLQLMSGNGKTDRCAGGNAFTAQPCGRTKTRPSSDAFGSA